MAARPSPATRRRPVRHFRYWLAFVLAGEAIAAILYHQASNAASVARRVAQSSDARRSVRDVSDDLRDLHLGVRDYLISGRRESLSPYHQANGRLVVDLATLRTAVGGWPDGPRRVTEIARLIRDVAAETSNQVDAADRNGDDVGRRRYIAFPTKSDTNAAMGHLATLRSEADAREGAARMMLDHAIEGVETTLSLSFVLMGVVGLGVVSGFLCVPDGGERVGDRAVDQPVLPDQAS